MNRYLFFSCESSPPAGYYFTKLMRPVEEAFNNRFSKERYSEMLDSISFIPICIADELLEEMGRKERKYVTKKGRYADIRLKMDFSEFVFGDETQKLRMSCDMIRESVQYITTKVSDFKADVFMEDIKSVFKEVYQCFEG